MTHHPAPQSLHDGLRELCRQLLPAFTGQHPARLPDPIAFGAIALAGRSAKDMLPRYSPQP